MSVSPKSEKPVPVDDMDPHTNSVCHVVMLQVTKKLDEEKLQKLLYAVRKHVPGLIELQFGANDLHMYKGKNELPAGNTHALFSRHENAEALRDYQRHSDHVALAKYLFAHIGRAPVVVDFVNIRAHL